MDTDVEKSPISYSVFENLMKDLEEKSPEDGELYLSALEHAQSIFTEGDMLPFFQYLRGHIAHKCGKFERAIHYYTLAEGGNPDLPQLLRGRGLLEFEINRYHLAVNYLNRYFEVVPYDHTALGWLVYSLSQIGRSNEAKTALNEYSAIFPYQEQTWRLNAPFALDHNEFLEAAIWASKLGSRVWTDPTMGEILLTSLLRLGTPSIAAHALTTWSAVPSAEFNLASWNGDLACFTADFALAEISYKTLIDNGTANQNVLVNYALALLSQGKFMEGAKYWRMRPPELKSWAHPDLPEINEIQTGQTLLINGEQGLGDVINFIRYIPELQKRGVRVVLNVYPEIQALLRNQNDSKDDDIDLAELDFDGQAQLYDLPGLLYRSGHWEFINKPYLNVSDERKNLWSERLACCTRPRVGLVWAGSPTHINDLQRSASLSDFLPLQGCGDINWISLQKGPTENEPNEWADIFPVLSFPDSIKDLSDTAAVLLNLDFVITVDTAVAHLAGALGCQGLLLLSNYAMDWRWRPEGAVQQWYPSLQGLVKPEGVSWREFIATIVADETRKMLQTVPRTKASQNPSIPKPSYSGSISEMVDRLNQFDPLENDSQSLDHLLESAMHHFPESGRVYFARGLLNKRANRIDNALSDFTSAVKRLPRHFDAWYELAVLQASREMSASAHAFQTLLQLPGSHHPRIWRDIASCSLSWNSPALALAILDSDVPITREEQAIRCQAHLALDNYSIASQQLAKLENLGDSQLTESVFLRIESCLVAVNQPLKAIDVVKAGLAQHPNSKKLKFNLGHRLLGIGDYINGWHYYSQGLPSKLPLFLQHIPEWKGEIPDTCHLLIWQDQGIGDFLQFYPLVSMLHAKKITLAVSLDVYDFIRDQHTDFCVVTFNELASQTSLSFDFQVPQMKLPGLLDCRLSSPLRRPPFFTLNHIGPKQWKSYCESDKSLRIGIIWAGNPNHPNDHNRSTTLSDWNSLGKINGINLYSFQKDKPSNQALIQPELQLKNIVADCHSLSMTATALSWMDLVISVDSGIAHLSATLGIPTWILLSNKGIDFRWGYSKTSEYAWYPTARIWRRDKNESWYEVLQRVSTQLETNPPKRRNHLVS